MPCSENGIPSSVCRIAMVVHHRRVHVCSTHSHPTSSHLRDQPPCLSRVGQASVVRTLRARPNRDLLRPCLMWHPVTLVRTTSAPPPLSPPLFLLRPTTS